MPGLFTSNLRYLLHTFHTVHTMSLSEEDAAWKMFPNSDSGQSNLILGYKAPKSYRFGSQNPWDNNYVLKCFLGSQ